MTVCNWLIWSLAAAFIVRIFNDGGEIFRFSQHLIRLKKLFSEFLKINPVESFPTLFTETIVEVITIDVCNDSGHHDLAGI
jgi:hypothetical protein